MVIQKKHISYIYLVVTSLQQDHCFVGEKAIVDTADIAVYDKMKKGIYNK